MLVLARYWSFVVKIMPRTPRTPKKAQNARRRTYTREKSEAVLTAMLEGVSLRAACRSVGVPASTFMTWVSRDTDGMCERYTRAQEIYAVVLADDCFGIADDASRDWIKKVGRGGSEIVVLDSQHLRRVELQLAYRRWLVEQIQSGALLRRRQGEDKDANEVTRTLAALQAIAARGMPLAKG